MSTLTSSTFFSIPRRTKEAFTALLLVLVCGLCGCGSEHNDTAKPGAHQEIALLGLTPAQHGQIQNSTPGTTPNTTQNSNSNSTTGVPAMAQDVTQRDLETIFNNGKSIPNFTAQTVEELSQCAQWAEPAAPDEMSREWYRAATTLHAVKLKTAEQYRQMLMLYEAAARRGHYRAMMHLTVLYTTGGMVREGRFRPEPLKARMWINEGLRRGWPGALEWLSTALKQGSADYPRNERESVKYLQLAARLGVPLAQYELGLYYDNELSQREKGVALFVCAGRQGFVSMASYKAAMLQRIRDLPEESLQLYQLAVMNGGEGGLWSSVVLYSAFNDVDDDPEKLELGTESSPARYQAYTDLNAALDGGKDSQGVRQEGNRFLRFPRLNEVLPLPPAEVSEWNGIYSAMSPEDAQYYQNPPPAEYYIDLARKAGYLVSDDYMGNPLVLED